MTEKRSIDIYIARKIKQLREERGLRANALSLNINKKKSYISNIEGGYGTVSID